MVSPIPPSKLLTLEAYLEFEAASPLRHEYVAGEVYAMTGASRRHNHIIRNILVRIHAAAAGGPCQVYFEAVKLRVGENIFYPDVIVTCSATDTDELIVREPCLLIEVTSPDTARSDRTDKLLAYRGIPALEAYLIVEQAWRRVERHYRDANGIWQRQNIQEGSVPVPCLDAKITLDEIYGGLAPLTVREMEAIGYSV